LIGTDSIKEQKVFSVSGGNRKVRAVARTKGQEGIQGCCKLKKKKGEKAAPSNSNKHREENSVVAGAGKEAQGKKKSKWDRGSEGAVYQKSWCCGVGGQRVQSGGAWECQSERGKCL